MLALDKEQVRLICPTMGGNFGGRGDFIAAGVTPADLQDKETRKDPVCPSGVSPGLRQGVFLPHEV